MTIPRAIRWVLVVVLATVGALLVYLSFADLAWLRPRIEAAVSESTAREFKIDGTFSLRALWTPSVVVEDAHLANAEWGSAPEMLRIGHLSARVDLWSLLSGPIRVEELRISDVELLVEENGDGSSNLDFGAAQEPEPEPEESGDAEVPLILELAEIRNVHLTARSADGRTREARLESLDVVTDDQQWLAIDGAGTVNELPLSISGRVGSIAALAASRDIGVDLKGGLGRLQFTADGTIATLQTIVGSQFDVVVTAEDVAPILERLSVDLPLQGPLHADLRVASEEGGTTVKFESSAGAVSAKGDARFEGRESIEFSLTVPKLADAGRALGFQGLPQGDLSVSGKLGVDRRKVEFAPLQARLGENEVVLKGTLSRGRKGDGQFSIDARVVSLDSLRAGLPPLPLEATTTIKRAPGRIELDPLELKLGNSDLTGTVRLETGAGKALQARFQSQRVDLGQLLAEPEDEQAPAAAEGSQDGPEQDKVFSSEPLPLDLLRDWNVDFSTAVEALTVGNGALGDVEAKVLVRDGRLQYYGSASGQEGGTAVSRLDMTASGSQAELTAQVFMRDLRINVFSGEDATPEQVPPISVTVDLRAVGGSAHDLASSTNGRILITQGPGRVENSLVQKFSGDLVAQVFRALNPFAEQDEYTNYECTVLALDVESGKAEISGMLTQGEKLKIVGGGDIDLGSEKLAIEFNTKPRKGVGVSADMFVTPFVKIGGTLAEPGVGLNQKGVLLAGGAAVATGGISLLVQGLLDRITGGTDSCDKLLEEVGGHPAVPQDLQPPQ